MKLSTYNVFAHRFVFCYRCIAQYVQENHCCPVTKYPTDMGDLIRIYSSNA